MEYGASAAVARWTSAGKQVTYLLATRGEAGIDGVDPKQAKKIRTREQIASCAAVGVRRLEFLDHPDGLINDVLRLRSEITSAIRRFRPEVVITMNHRETWGGRALNMSDHRVLGTAVLDAVRDAANRWIFADLRTADRKPLEKWDGVRFTAVANSPTPTHAVDISESIDAGIASLLCHSTYLSGLGAGSANPDKLLRETAEQTAARFGGRLAVGFEVFH
jgi:LmbE family N-acetylglucosaminyl deacetylase